MNSRWALWLEDQGVKLPDTPKVLHPLGATSMYATGEPPRAGYPKPTEVSWQRLTMPKGGPARLWVDGATSSDPKQGALGDCWLISALSLIATRDGTSDSTQFLHDGKPSHITVPSHVTVGM